MKKIILGSVLLVSVLFLNYNIVEASENESNQNMYSYQKNSESTVRKNQEDLNKTDIKLNNLIITSEHSIETIDVELLDTEDKVIANVYSKGTSELIESFSEEKAPNNLIQNRAKTSTYNSTVSARYRIGNSKSKIYVISYANVNISAGSGWAQINKKPSKIWQSPDSSGSWVLKNKNQSVRNTKFPTTSLGLNIQGLVEISSNVGTDMGLSFEVMKGMGFNMSGKSQNTWYARQNYNSTVYIKTMW